MCLAQSPGGVPGCEAWLVTTPVGSDLNGSYRWADLSGDSVRVLTAGGVEYTRSRDSVQTFNFHPALRLSSASGQLSAHLRQAIPGQCTVIGVFAPRLASVTSDMTLYMAAGADTTAVSRTQVIHSGGGSLPYDGHWLTDSARSPRVITWERAASPPVHSVWGSASGVILSPGGASPLFPGAPPVFDGWCPELLAYGRVLSPLERRQAESYLALKYGLTLDGSYWLGDRVVWNLSGGDTLHRAYGYDAVGNITGSQGSNGDGGFSATYSYDALDRLVSASQSYGGGGSSASCGLTMSYDDLWRVTSKSQHVSQTGLTCPGTLSAGYDMTYTYGTDPGTHYQLRNVAETSYRTEATPTTADNILNTHSHSYDPNGNLAYVATGRTRSDGSLTDKMSERKLLWDAQNRLRALSDDGYVSLYWYDADGDRTVRERHGGEAVWVNSEPGGMVSGAPRWTPSPDGFITFDGTDSYTEHVYIGDERVASIRRPFSTEYYADNVQHLAGVGLGSGVDYSVLISKMRDAAADACDSLGVPWGSYTSSGNTRSGEPTIRHIRMAPTSQDGDTTRPRTPQPDYSQDSVYYYHRDHLGGTMTVTDGAGAPVQQVEYTPWGEVFVELRNGNSGFATPYLFNGKELDEETGLYYYGARYYDPKMSVWYSTDPMEMDYPGVTTYGYCLGNPVNAIDSHGSEVVWAIRNGSYSGIIKALNNTKTYNTIFYRFLKNQDNVTISTSSNMTYFGYAPSLRSNNGYNIYIGNNGFVKNGILTIDATILAKVIMHEGLHSKYQLINDEGNLSYYPTLNNHMQVQAERKAKGYSYEGEHETMAEGNIQTFVKGMKEFDANYGTCHSNDWYNAIAWMGSLREASTAWWDLDETTRNKYMLIQGNEQLYMDYLEAKATYIGNKTNKNRAAMNRARQSVNWKLFNQTRSE